MPSLPRGGDDLAALSVDSLPAYLAQERALMGRADLGVAARRRRLHSALQHALGRRAQHREHARAAGVLKLEWAAVVADRLDAAQAAGEVYDERAGHPGVSGTNACTVADAVGSRAEALMTRRIRSVVRAGRHLELDEPTDAAAVGVWRAMHVDELRHQAATIVVDQRGGSAVVYRRAATDLLAGLADVDLLLTDPPYCTDVDEIDAFAAEWLPLALATLNPTGRALIFIGGYPREVAAYLAALGEHTSTAQLCVWHYPDTLGPSPTQLFKTTHQLILHVPMPAAPPLASPLLTDTTTVQTFAMNSGLDTGRRLHPWQKPDALARRLVGLTTRVGQLVADPFAGTGTFLAAAAALGRRGIGCDLDSAQIDACQARGIQIGAP